MALGLGPSQAGGIILWLGTTALVAATDTYTRVGSLSAISQYGIKWDEVTFEDLSLALELTYKGLRKDGTITVGLGQDMSDDGQNALRAAAAAQTGDYNVKITYADQVPVRSATVTMTIAGPGVVTDTAHGLAVNTPVSLATTGALPTGLVAGTTYYVKTVVSVDTYTLSATPGGTVITTSGSQSGTHTRSTVPAPTYDLMKAKIMGFEVDPGNLQSVVKAMATIKPKSGSLATTARIPIVEL
jgi:hypothetical protein